MPSVRQPLVSLRTLPTPARCQPWFLPQRDIYWARHRPSQVLTTGEVLHDPKQEAAAVLVAANAVHCVRRFHQLVCARRTSRKATASGGRCSPW